MKNYIIFQMSLLLGVWPIFAQQNNILRGKMLFLSSGKSPAMGVEISGTIQGNEKANIVYTADNGTYELIFPKARDGYKVSLKIGTKDKYGTLLELVNAKEVEICQIPANPSDGFNIIVCEKGSRDLAAQKYYKIIKTSADIALSEANKEINRLLEAEKKDHEKIGALFEQVKMLKEKTDSISIYKEAYNIASINKDDASKRVLKYLQLLDDGRSIQQAREVLSIERASSDLNKGISLIDVAMEELQIRASASKAIFDYEDAIACYDTIISYSERMEINPLKISEYYLEISNVSYEAGYFEKSLIYDLKSVRIREQNLNPQDPALMTSYNNIAGTYQALGKPEKSLKYLQRILNVRKETLSPTHMNLANTYHNIAVTYRDLDQYAAALEHQRMAISIREKSLDFKNPALATYYNNLAITFKHLSQLDSALIYLRMAITIQEEILNSEHPELATSYNNIGNIYQALGRYDSALLYQEKAVAIQKKVLSIIHPELAISYNNIGSVCRAYGKFEEALEHHHKTLEIREKILEPGHPSLAIAHNNVGLDYHHLDQNEKALEHYHKAILIQEILNPEHSNMAIFYNNIGLALYDLGQFRKAMEYYLKSVEILDIKGESNQINLAITYNNIGLNFQKMSLYEKALSYQLNALNIFNKYLPFNHPNIAITFKNIGDIYQAIGKYEKALDYYLKAIVIQKEILEINHPSLGNSYLEIANTYKAIGLFSKAILYIEDCLQIYSKSLPQDHSDLILAHNRFLEIYEAKAIDAYQRKDYFTALIDFEIIFTYADSNYTNLGNVWNYVGLSKFYLKNYTEAIQAYQEAIIHSPELKNQDFYTNIGLAYAKNHQFQEAETAFTEYGNLFPKDGKTYRNWAMYYALQNENEKAIIQLRKAVKLGYEDWDWLEKDDGMKNLRKEKAFIKLIKKRK